MTSVHARIAKPRRCMSLWGANLSAWGWEWMLRVAVKAARYVDAMFICLSLIVIGLLLSFISSYCRNHNFHSLHADQSAVATACNSLARAPNALILCLQPRRMGAPNGAPVAPPSTISSTALTYEESSEARKSTALAMSSDSPQRPSGIAEDTNFANLADSSVEIEARGPRFQIGVFVAPGATTFTRMLRGARSAATARAIETTPPLVAAYAATPGWPR